MTTELTNQLPALKEQYGDRKPHEYEIRHIVRRLLDYFGFFSWGFDWNRRKRALGTCNYTKKQIQLSIHFFNTLEGNDEIFDTILHEIAHAIAGVRAGHGYAWRNVARKIGANPNRLACLPPEQKPKGRYGARYDSMGEGEVVTYRHRYSEKLRTAKYSIGKRRIYWYDLHTGKLLTTLDSNDRINRALERAYEKVIGNA
jgi:predicted SprT family Zn-dependent metalloprotease